MASAISSALLSTPLCVDICFVFITLSLPLELVVRITDIVNAACTFCGQL